MAQIASALSSCTAGETVLLNPGTYSSSSSLIVSTSNVTLRGSGPTQTILNFTNTSTNCLGIGPTAVCLWNGDDGAIQYAANFCPWTAGFSQGTTTITVGTCTTGALSNLKVGSLIVLSQNDDASDNGNAYFCGSTSCSQQADTGNAIPGQAEIQVVAVTGISGSNVTISPGLYAPQWSSSKSPQISFSSSLPISNFGLENLTINTSSSTAASPAAMVQFVWAFNSWVQNVALINGTASSGTGTAFHKHVWVADSPHITVQHTYEYGSSPTSEAYGVDFWESSDDLAQNNIFQHIATGEMLEGSSGGVMAYNYAVDNYYNNGAPNWQQCDQFHHNAADYYNLWEGNIGICNTQDDIHGTAFANTIFRNALSGFDPATEVATKNQNLLAINDMAFARYINIVANVLGFGDKATTYQYIMASGTDCGPSNPWTYIYDFDDSDQNVSALLSACGFSGVQLDNDVGVSGASPDLSVMRWGNWDAVNNAVRTVTGENGSGANTYPALSSPSTTWSSYPSLYLASKPAWWVFPSGNASTPWPGIGPDVSSGNISNTSGHAFLNPAANCYLNVIGGSTSGSSGALSFDANTCYYSSESPAPAAPSGVKAAVQTLGSGS